MGFYYRGEVTIILSQKNTYFIYHVTRALPFYIILTRINTKIMKSVIQFTMNYSSAWCPTKYLMFEMRASQRKDNVFDTIVNVS